MKDFEYNWATAEIMKLYLRNSRAQAARKACAISEVSAGTQDASATNSELTNNDVGMSHPTSDSESDSDSSSDEDQ